MVHSFLLIGQSNMAGRGIPSEVEPINNKRIKILRNGRWQEMWIPISTDRSFAGISLAESFADAYSKEHNVDVGLIPCAESGSSLDQWTVSGLLYDNAIYQAKLAARTSTIAGVLWHQGEGDCGEELYPHYEEKFNKIMAAFRKDLNLYDVPFVLGELGSFLKYRSEVLKNYIYVNKQLKKIADTNSMTGLVSAEGLGANEDNLHFNAKSLREFGLRYYKVFMKLENKNKIFKEKSTTDSEIRTGLELL